ncbi:MAG: cysteine--tRNA ligase, partial [Candidatus Aenigmatarchaeota archaeon]
MSLEIYNTLSDEKEEFEPIEDDKVKMFVCGVTEYDDLHLGHVRTYTFYDFLSRFLENQGYDVQYLQNVTDVGHLTEGGEDKIIKKSKQGEWNHPKEVAEYYEKKHMDINDELRIKRADLMPRATGHIPEIINDVEELIEKGYAYESNGSVYFELSKFEDYGKLSNVDTDKLKEEEVVEFSEEKRDPKDFALWKSAEPEHIMKWDSPWGEGYPGWHIEDTAMARKYLGEQYDLHGGAVELAFPHHEAEIAQGEAASGKKPFVKYWVHTGLVTVDGEKMSKSKGNFVTAEEALENYRPEVLRLWSLSSHYKKPVDYSEGSLEEYEKRVDNIDNTNTKIERILDESVD